MAVCWVILGGQKFYSYTLTTLIPLVLKFHMGLMHLWCPSIVNMFSLYYLTVFHHQADGHTSALSSSSLSPQSWRRSRGRWDFIVLFRGLPLPTPPAHRLTGKPKMPPLSPPPQLNPTHLSPPAHRSYLLFTSHPLPLFSNHWFFFQSFYKIFTMCGQTSFSGNLEEGGVFILKASDKKEWGRGEKEEGVQEQQEGESRSR